MKIYTKTGDTGQTSLLGGARVPKHHLRIESYGTVDELNSHLGMLRDVLPEGTGLEPEIVHIQETLFTLGSHLAAEPGKANVWLPDLNTTDVELLEKAIDRMNAALPAMKHFILPGGHPAVSAAHIARCVCRRAERLCVHLHELENTHPLIVQYLNRLSDYLFMAARWIAQTTGSEETPWKPRG